MTLPVRDTPKRRRWQHRYPVKTDIWPRIPCPHCGRDIAVSPTGKASTHALPDHLGPDESACLHGCCCVDEEQMVCPQSGQEIEDEEMTSP